MVDMSEKMHVGLRVKYLLLSSISKFRTICSEIFDFFKWHTCM